MHKNTPRAMFLLFFRCSGLSLPAHSRKNGPAGTVRTRNAGVHTTSENLFADVSQDVVSLRHEKRICYDFSVFEYLVVRPRRGHQGRGWRSRHFGSRTGGSLCDCANGVHHLSFFFTRPCGHGGNPLSSCAPLVGRAWLVVVHHCRLRLFAAGDAGTLLES